ncbi:exosome complex exonuclease-like protein Rrp6 [Phyllosticta citribraziliensis]|uniref:Exosome complex exonuclease-like protein Rrp6 n=1 Tax=Phyllosticta citribraziliensis TaxID=989973 RepID=A0ABR1L5J0_9PEZI
MENFSEFQKTAFESLLATTNDTRQICEQDLGFHRSLDPTVGSALDKQNARLLALAERLLGNAAAGSEVVGPRLEDTDAVDGQWRGIVDVIDSLLERADTSLDEYTGIVKRLTPSKEQVGASASAAVPAHSGMTTTQSPAAPASKPGVLAKMFRNLDLPKPQSLFEHAPTNDKSELWKPLLTSKPHATVPLDQSLVLGTGEDGRSLYQNPYTTEISNYQFPPSVYTKADPIPYTPFESTTATFVDTPEALDAMLAELKKEKVIAIDLEHHDQRSYIGLVSLMQISTRDKDWVVDTLKPWRRRLECLNEVFADPSIVKVLHGAFMDVMWLQRDLGLYLVGLFDTYHACRALGYPQASLAFLLSKFVNFQAQKQYQMADWRIRPLPQELFDYARSDTHFLLYIFDNMRNELIDKSDFSNPEEDRVRRVQEKSKEESMQAYSNPSSNPENGSGSMGWYRQLYKNPNAFNKEQFSVFKAVHAWRDAVARQEDEGVHFVLPNHILFSISRSMPTDKVTLFNVAPSLSGIARLRADEIVGTVVRAKEEGANGPEMWAFFGAKPPQSNAQAAANGFQAIGNSPAFKELKASATQDTGSLRATFSNFWGNLARSAFSQRPRQYSTESVSLAVPLPPLTAEVFADPNDAPAKQEKPVDPGARAEHQFVKAEDRPTPKEEGDGVFTVKQLGRKRKIGEVATSQGETEQADSLHQQGEADEEPVDPEQAEKTRKKAEKRAAKKAKKQAKKAAEEQQQGEDEDQENSGDMDVDGGDGEAEQPFDYGAEASLLTPNEGGPKDKKKRKKEFNPYAKAADVPKGMGRVQKERAGKSATFIK